MNKNKKQEDHWLVRPQTINTFWIFGMGILVLLILADFFVKHKAYFEVDGWITFGAIYGLLAAVVLVFGSKVIGAILKRSDTYYDN